MTTVELARLIVEMRAAQKEYFRTRTQGALERSKQLERQLDRAVVDVLRQPTLFDAEQAR
jgi:hypothetical protein